MAAFNKVNSFITAVCTGTHNAAINASTDTMKVYLSNATPSASLDSLKADIAEITNQNGYTAPSDINNATSQTGGTITVTATSLSPMVTATGTVGPFQYVVLYNSTAASSPLWGWWDYGSALTLNNGDTFTVTFGASLATFA